MKFRKLKLGEILTESWAFYRANFGKLTVYAAILFLGMSLSNLNTYLNATMFYETAVWRVFSSLIILVVMWIVIAPKFFMAIYIYINSLSDGEDISFKQAYRRTKGLYWWYVGTALILGLIALPFVIILILIFGLPGSAINNPAFFMLPAMAIFTAVFYLVFPSVALSDVGDGLIRKSLRLVRGNILRILALVLLTSTIIALPYNILFNQFVDSPLTQLKFATGLALVNIFVSTFADVVRITVYRKLTMKIK